MKKMRSLPLARKPKPEMIVHKSLEEKARQYVQSKYFGTFVQRYEDGLVATGVVLGSLVIGLPFALLLP
ncbi:hypothetical protein GF391_04150, partial [Candidatus Uhrbacteria bacterium]|nr:hypothetical protein [Candidatus Uhrbacteria bacterium]